MVEVCSEVMFTVVLGVFADWFGLSLDGSVLAWGGSC